MNELALFAGAGGGILGGRLLGWRTRCAVELDAYARRVLLARQRDGHLERFPIWDDVCTFDGEPWRGHIDVISGGFPCQDISVAGKGAGLEGSRSGLWREMARIICEVGPRWVFLENSPMLTSRGLGTVLGDLASMGYDARWGVLGARHVGAPHRRDRIWLAARYADGEGQPVKPFDDEAPRVPSVGDTDSKGLQGLSGDESCPEGWPASIGPSTEAGLLPREAKPPDASSERHWTPDEEVRAGRRGVVDGSWWAVEPDVGRVANAYRIGQLEGAARALELTGRAKAIGAGVPARASKAAHASSERHGASDEEVRAGRDGVVDGSWWETEPDVGRVAHGVASRVDRLRALGNGQVPAVAALAWQLLTVGWSDE